MRRLAILAIVLGCGGTTAAYAATAQTGPGQPAAERLKEAAFASNGAAADLDPIGGLLDRQALTDGLTDWRAHAAQIGGNDSLMIRQGSTLGPGVLPLTQRSAADEKAYEISLMRRWPGAVNFDAGRVNVDVSPHAGLGVIGGDHAPQGGSAEAGATLQVSKADIAGDRLKALGVKDGAQFGQQGRWYLFAAASGRAVGMNMLHGEQGWNRAGWSTDTTSKLVGDAQVGVGWRKGAMQTSVGYVHRKVKGEHLLYGVDPHDDDMVAFSLSIRPRK